MPSKGSSYALNCSFPGRGISGLLRGWLFPFSISCFIGAFFRCPFCFRRPRARNLVMIFTRTKCLQILFSGAIVKGKSLALQARTPCPTWFQRESLMPLLRMLFSEIPVVLWLGNCAGTSLTRSSFCQNTKLAFTPRSSIFLQVVQVSAY